MIVALLLSLQAAPTVGADVVVTGERLKKLHDQCKAGRCTPLRDAQASIAWAETQFREGRYMAAKSTLRAAAARNERHASAHPKPVAAIYEAYATVSWQEGDRVAYRRATANRVRTLRDHLPGDDVAVRGAALALGDMWQRMGNPPEAERAYAAVEREAAAAGSADVALRARLARVRVKHSAGRRKEASDLLASAHALAPDISWARPVIEAMRIRLAATDGVRTKVDQLASNLGLLSFARPVLVHAPPFPRTGAEWTDAARREGIPVIFGGLPVNFGPSDPAGSPVFRWADIGFWIRPDGRTAEAEVLTSSRLGGWTAPILKQIAGRRYTSTSSALEGDPGVYRIERFTLRLEYVLAPPKESLVRIRMGPLKLEMLDLTESNAKVAAAR